MSTPSNSLQIKKNHCYQHVWPPTPAVYFNFTSSFLYIPTFDFPYVKIIGVQASGGCPDLESKVNNDDDSDRSDDGDGSPSSSNSFASPVEFCSSDTFKVCQLLSPAPQSEIQPLETSVSYTTTCEQMKGRVFHPTTSMDGTGVALVVYPATIPHRASGTPHATCKSIRGEKWKSSSVAT